MFRKVFPQTIGPRDENAWRGWLLSEKRYPEISILPSQVPTLFSPLIPFTPNEQCELPISQAVPPDYMKSLNYGKDFVQFLAPEIRGFWYTDPAKTYDARMQIAVGYYYEGSQFYLNPYVGDAFTEAFARKYYYEANRYGSENGRYRTLGTLQSIRDRVITIRENQDDPDIVIKTFEEELGDYFNFDYAYGQAGRILNTPDPSWCQGILLDRPATWGDFNSKTEKDIRDILPEFVEAVTSENQGELSSQIYRIQIRMDGNEIRYFFVMTQDQINQLCFGGSCVAPNPEYVSQERKNREK